MSKKSEHASRDDAPEGAADRGRVEGAADSPPPAPAPSRDQPAGGVPGAQTPQGSLAAEDRPPKAGGVGTFPDSGPVVGTDGKIMPDAEGNIPETEVHPGNEPGTGPTPGPGARPTATPEQGDEPDQPPA